MVWIVMTGVNRRWADLEVICLTSENILLDITGMLIESVGYLYTGVKRAVAMCGITVLSLPNHTPTYVPRQFLTNFTAYQYDHHHQHHRFHRHDTPPRHTATKEDYITRQTQIHKADFRTFALLLFFTTTTPSSYTSASTPLFHPNTPPIDLVINMPKPKKLPYKKTPKMITFNWMGEQRRPVFVDVYQSDNAVTIYRNLSV